MRVTSRALRPTQQLNAVAGHFLTIGDYERLAGINTCSHRERTVLWNEFRHLYSGPPQRLVDAVMERCAEIALRRIAAGELVLLATRRPS